MLTVRAPIRHVGNASGLIARAASNGCSAGGHDPRGPGMDAHSSRVDVGPVRPWAQHRVTASSIGAIGTDHGPMRRSSEGTVSTPISILHIGSNGECVSGAERAAGTQVAIVRVSSARTVRSVDLGKPGIAASAAFGSGCWREAPRHANNERASPGRSGSAPVAVSDVERMRWRLGRGAPTRFATVQYSIGGR